jgi:hypothetical protein
MAQQISSPDWLKTSESPMKSAQLESPS